MRFSVAFATFFCILSALWPNIVQAQDEFVPRDYRVKIDSIDVSKAPAVHISATFLDKRSRPIDPNDIQAAEVYCDGEQVKVTPKLTSFFEGSVPLDIALILPISTRFTDNEREEMKASIAKLIKSKRTENARIAGFFDDGRAINVAPLGEAKDVEKLLNAMKPEGQPSFLYSSLEKAMEEMTDPAKLRNPARRAIILVTDAFDTYTFRSTDVQREMNSVLKEARANDIRIYVVMFKPFIRGLLPMFEGLSRKTGGTYRYAATPDLIVGEVESAWGEIVAQLQLDFKMPKAREGLGCEYSIIVTNKDGLRVNSEKYEEVVFGKIAFNWRPLIIAGIVLGVLLVVALVVFLLLRRSRKKKAQKQAELEEQLLQERIEKGEVCPKCKRTLLADWKECMFCARESTQELTQAKAQEREKALADAEKKGINIKDRLCPDCGRTMMPQWKECLFCKAGIGAGEDGKKSKAKKGVAPIFGAQEKKDPNEGLKICSQCNRPMKAHWTTCLYCEAQRSAGGAHRSPEVMDKPSENLRNCPDCGRPMKAHWDICLFCEANRYRD